jgi:hypothetical protein
MSTLRHRGLAATLTISALAVAACGGGTATTKPDTVASGAPAASAATTAAPPESAAPSSGAVASLPIAIPSFDLSTIGGAIPGVDSYRVAFTSDGKKQYESVVVTKPEVAKHVTTFKGDGTPDTEFIVIGKEAWTSDGSGGWTPVPGQLAQAMLAAFDPAILFGAYANANWVNGAADKGTEERNGIQAHHFSIDPTMAIGAAAGLPADASIDLWVADAGYLVALEIAADGTTKLGIDVSNVNDPANVVTAPAG